MCGRPPAALHALEPTGHKSLHGNLALFGGMPAQILQRSAGFYALKTPVLQTLDNTYTASLPTKSILHGDKAFNDPTTQNSHTTFTNEL